MADLFAPSQVGAPMGVFSASPFLGKLNSTSRKIRNLSLIPWSPGPVLGPIISGFINMHVDWRWTWRVFIIWAGVELLALAVFVPETFLPRLLAQKAKRLRKAGRTEVRAPLDVDDRSIAMVVARSCITPFKIGASELMATILSLWTSLLLGILYLFFS